MTRIHLISNAHLDPTWMWSWEEGAAEALSTFRVAAELCEQNESFVFNHNEAILYKWVEEYEPELFERIRRLVKAGRWHIMGGWYLQPDCNMPCGESLVRQMLTGRLYFQEKFGVRPATAVNLDPFGHPQGLVQILKKAGFTSYLFCRPDQAACPLPADDFTWVGYDGSTIIGHRASEFYNSPYGHAVDKVQKWMAGNGEREVGLILWGVGDHGGGPSRIDVAALQALIASTPAHEIVHSTPEAYCDDLLARHVPLPEHCGDLNYFGPGCYTSEIRIKQKHRQLENELYMAEKMSATAALNGEMAYPRAELNEAITDLVYAEFHDILPGDSAQEVEENSLRLMDHGLEILSRVKARAFFALCRGQQKAQAGEIPILIYNPHPYKVQGIFECEFQLPDQNWKEEFTLPLVHQDGRPLPAQPEHEHSNVNLDWRKRVVFAAELEPGQVNRFDCTLQVLPQKPRPQLHAQDGKIIFQTADVEVVINCATGLIDRYRVQGVDYLCENACLPLVIQDNDDPWGMTVDRFREVVGQFGLMSPEAGTAFSGVHAGLLDSVRVIEDGEVRSVVEAVLSYHHSFVCLRYKLPKRGAEIEIEVRVHWNEKSRMLKLSIPTVFAEARYLGQAVFGIAERPVDGKETMAQKWVGVFSDRDDLALTCINDGTYGSDFSGGEMRLSLVRSPGYVGHPIHDRPIMPQDRYSPRIDQGERLFTFWLKGGPAGERREHVDREALCHNEKPFPLSFSPSGAGRTPLPAVVLEDDAVQLSALKKAERTEDYIIRLFEPSGQPRTTTVAVPLAGLRRQVALGKFEVKTLRLDVAAGTLSEANLMED